MNRSTRLLQFTVTLLCFLLLVACSDVPEEETASAMGNGSGGRSTGLNLVTRDITKVSGEVIATYQYDGDVFTEIFSAASTAETIFLILTDITGSDISITSARIIGRPDTACRYQAAVLARDQNFEIEDTTLKTNASGIEFYHVSIRKSADYRDLYCASLSDQIGVSFTITASSAEFLRYQQVYFLLNSVVLK